MKTEIWNGYPVRFVEKDGEWWAVAKDVTDALGFAQAHDGTRKMPEKYKGRYKVPTTSNKTKSPEAQEMIVLNEKGLYRLIMRSHKPEAEEFQDWVFEMLKALRQSTGLEGFQIFRLLDKDHQKEAMAKLSQALRNPVRVDFVKANMIANKAVSSKHGYPKMIKKGAMSPEMLVDRQELLDSTVELMGVKEKYNLNLSVSEEVYKLAAGQKENQSA
ncbi:MAG: BRO family protein [Lacrimispora sp.]|uniref:BRO-N domain-containing protein n=1 Tax=Lacrimispora sp. TaxID=2719234 RepID=UPI0039E5A505